MSDRKSTSSPDACSGDIYAGVPTRLPGMVCAPALLSNDPEDGPDEDSAMATGSASSADLAAQRGLAEFAQAVEQLRQTNFRVPQALLDALLEKHKEKKGHD